MSATATSGVTVSKANLISDDMCSYLLASWNWILHISSSELCMLFALASCVSTSVTLSLLCSNTVSTVTDLPVFQKSEVPQFSDSVLYSLIV